MARKGNGHGVLVIQTPKPANPQPNQLKPQPLATMPKGNLRQFSLSFERGGTDHYAIA